LKYSEILQANKNLAISSSNDGYKISVLSNIITSKLNEILEYKLRIVGIPAIVKSGEYDNIVQDSLKIQDSNAVIIFWELCNIIDGLQSKIELLNDDELNAIIEKIKSEIDFVIKNLETKSLVLINKFTSIQFRSMFFRKNNFDELADQLNDYLRKKISTNVKLIDLEKVMLNVGIENSCDFRYYYSSKALYTISFFKAYSEYISPLIKSVNGKSKKALIFDCDNTLWKGILGEDGFDNIEMSEVTKDGSIFAEIQSIALYLNKQGIIIGLCSKNNSEDIAKVIKSHPDMQLRDQYISINKSNWLDKVTNLNEIANELNIGLDSIVFIDDSPFEVNLINQHLPEVTVLQVPERLSQYPNMLRNNINLFYNLSFTDEDKKKVNMYKQQTKRVTHKKSFTNIDDYLASLDMKISIPQDNKKIISRISQMSQKTNQFNLTTKRYTETKIRNFINNKSSIVIAFSVSDKFGDNGITGLCIIIINDENKSAHIDTLLMSCRIIGRNIEYAFIDYIIEKIKMSRVKSLTSKFIKTNKNDQVIDFFENCGFSLIESTDSIKNYSLDISTYKPNNISYIKVVDE